MMIPQIVGGCMTTTRAIKQERFKELTKTIDCDNPREVRLAQNLYIEMMN
jgi:hypothetical protein